MTTPVISPTSSKCIAVSHKRAKAPNEICADISVASSLLERPDVVAVLGRVPFTRGTRRIAGSDREAAVRGTPRGLPRRCTTIEPPAEPWCVRPRRAYGRDV